MEDKTLEQLQQEIDAADEQRYQDAVTKIDTEHTKGWTLSLSDTLIKYRLFQLSLLVKNIPAKLTASTVTKEGVVDAFKVLDKKFYKFVITGKGMTITLSIAFVVVALLVFNFVNYGIMLPLTAKSEVVKGVKDFNKYPGVVKLHSWELEWLVKIEKAKKYLISKYPEVRETWRYSEYKGKFDSAGIHLVVPIDFDWQTAQKEIENKFKLPTKFYTVENSRFTSEGEKEVILIISADTGYDYKYWYPPVWGELPVQKGTYPLD